MTHSICGIDCSECELKNNCEGCVETNGRPFQELISDIARWWEGVSSRHAAKTKAMYIVTSARICHVN